MDHGNFPAEGIVSSIPFFSLYLPLPVDRAPPLITWAKFAPSIWTAWESEREPFEVKAATHKVLSPGDRLEVSSVGVARGYTRASIIAFGIARTLMVEDISTFSEAEKAEFTKQLAFIILAHVQPCPSQTKFIFSRAGQGSKSIWFWENQVHLQMCFAYVQGIDVREQSQGASQIINLVTIKPLVFDLVFPKPNSFLLLEWGCHFQLGLTIGHNFQSQVLGCGRIIFCLLSNVREVEDCSKMSVIPRKPRSFQ